MWRAELWFDVRMHTGDAQVGDGFVLETERLVLRRLTLGDLDALAAIYADPDVRRYFPEGTLTRAETREELEWIIDIYYGRYGYGLWATILKESERFVGRCGLLPWDIVSDVGGALILSGASEDPPGPGATEVELAYLLARPYWGLGLATEAARAIVAYGIEEFRLERLICLIDPGNEASIRVATRAGMSFDRHVIIDGERVPMYALSTR